MFNWKKKREEKKRRVIGNHQNSNTNDSIDSMSPFSAVNIYSASESNTDHSCSSSHESSSSSYSDSCSGSMD